MTPPTLDLDVVTRRLRLIDDTLAELRALGDLDAQRLETEAVTRAAAERFLQVIVDLAIDVNTHLVAALLGQAPRTGRDTFEAASETGALPADLAERLAPSAGLRNVLVHRYADIRADLVAAAVGEALTGYAGYVSAIAAFLRTRVDPE